MNPTIPANNLADTLGQADGLIAFLGEQVAFTYRDYNGELVFKHLSTESLKQAFTGQTIDSGWWQPGIMRWGISPVGEWYVRFTPPATYTIELAETAGGGKLTLPLPAMVMFAHAGRYLVASVKESTFSPSSYLYHAPLPNCYGDGSVCWGTTNTKPQTTQKEAEKAWRLFISSPFNRDLADRKSKKYNDNVLEMLKEVADSLATEYPLDDLIPFGVGGSFTVEEILTRLVKGGIN